MFTIESKRGGRSYYYYGEKHIGVDKEKAKQFAHKDAADDIASLISKETKNLGFSEWKVKEN